MQPNRSTSKDYFWGCALTKEKPSQLWTSVMSDDEDEDDDNDLLMHTLMLNQAALGPNCKEGEKNVVEVHASTFSGNVIKQPLLTLVGGKSLQCPLTISFQSDVTFKLAQGNGPVYLSATHTVSISLDDDDMSDEEMSDDEDIVPGLSKPSPAKKRPALDQSPEKGLPNKKIKTESPKKAVEKPKAAASEKKAEKPKAAVPEKKAEKPKPAAKMPLSPADSDADEDSDDENEDMDFDVERAAQLMAEESDDDEEDDDEEEEDDDEDMDEEDDDSEDEEEDSPPKKKADLKKPQMNGNAEKKVNKKDAKTPDKAKKAVPASPTTPKTYDSAEMKNILKKTPSLPKSSQKFTNFLQSRFKLKREEAEKSSGDLWKWVQGGMK